MNIVELEKTLWNTAKKLRNNAAPEAYKHQVSGLFFLKYITDTSDDKSVEDLAKGKGIAANFAHHEEYIAYNEFFVPEKAQWAFLQSHAKQPEIGSLIDNATDVIEKLNENIKGTLPKDYSNPGINKAILGELIILIGQIGHGRKGPERKQMLARVFEYLLGKFAETEGKKGNEFYSPPNVVRLLAEMTGPRKGKVYDGCCGTGGTFVQSEKFIKKYRVKIDSVAFYGQDIDAVAIKLAKINLTLHGIEANLQVANTFTSDCHTDVKADFILACPPFSQKDWKEGRSRDDKRWNGGAPPAQNANYAWLQHFIGKLSPAGTAGIVLNNDSLNSNSAEERKIRKNLIDARLVDCIVALPPQLFYNTEMSACIWLLSKNKTNNTYRNPNEILFIDASKLGMKGNRTTRKLTDENILLISKTYHRWRNINGDYMDIKGFCKAVPIEQVSRNAHLLVPQKYTSGRVNKLFPALLLIILLFIFYFTALKNDLFTSKPAIYDTAYTVHSHLPADSIQPEKKVSKTVRGKAKDKPVEAENKPIEIENKPAESENKSSADTVHGETNTVQNKPAAEPPLVQTHTPPEAKNESPANGYKVISKAYFYDEPDERTRRNAFITHWNNSYADIEARDEKNGFIFVVFTNHLNQTSKGWLRKKDLKQADE